MADQASRRRPFLIPGKRSRVMSRNKLYETLSAVFRKSQVHALFTTLKACYPKIRPIRQDERHSATEKLSEKGFDHLPSNRAMPGVALIPTIRVEK